MAFFPSLGGRNGRGIKRYSDKERRHFTKLVREGMPKWKVCREYGIASATLYRILQVTAPNTIRKHIHAAVPGRRKKEKRQGGRYVPLGPMADGVNVLCPQCHPPQPLTPETGHDPYEAGNQLHQETDGNGVLFDTCSVCGYHKRLTPNGGGR